METEEGDNNSCMRRKAATTKKDHKMGNTAFLYRKLQKGQAKMINKLARDTGRE